MSVCCDGPPLSGSSGSSRLSDRTHHMAAPSGTAAQAAPAGLPPPQPRTKASGGGGGSADADSGRQRKPYVMSKPRETWTDAEHALFIEALKL